MIVGYLVVNVSLFGRSGLRFALAVCVVAVCAIALLLLSSSNASATVMVQLSDAQLAARSDVIVVGEVRSVRSRIVLEKDAARPYTFVEISVAESQKGAIRAGEVLVLQEEGGAWQDGMHAAIAGTPDYRVGERVLVFAQRAKHLREGRFRTTAMAQGKFIVDRGADTEVVRRDLRGLSFVDWSPLGDLRVQEGELEAARPIDSVFKSQLTRSGQP